jgi:hypothetical protein
LDEKSAVIVSEKADRLKVQEERHYFSKLDLSG